MMAHVSPAEFPPFPFRTRPRENVSHVAVSIVGSQLGRWREADGELDDAWLDQKQARIDRPLHPDFAVREECKP